MDKKYILILHNMGHPSGWRESVAELELALPHYAKEHQYLIHDASLPLPDYAREFNYDAIILNSTFLGAVFNPERLNLIKKQYEFIKHSNSLKIALPQDDYYCCEELDGLMKEWEIDLTYTVCPEHWDMLYPKYLEAGGNLRLGYTGYITPRMRERTRNPKNRSARKFDVVYRASGIPSFPNRMATVKSTIGITFMNAFSDQRWSMDISTSDSKAILGAKWWDFIEDSRFVLGSNSGSSHLIRNHSIVKRIREYKNQFPEAEDDLIIRQCIPSDDCKYTYSAISPRALEAGLLETVQLLVPGPYSGLLEAWEHFVPLQEDCSNRRDVIDAVKDISFQEKIANTCKTKLLETKQIHIESLISDILAAIFATNRNQQNIDRAIKFRKISEKYHNQMPLKYKIHYSTIKKSLRKMLPSGIYSSVKKYMGM